MGKVEAVGAKGVAVEEVVVVVVVLVMCVVKVVIVVVDVIVIVLGVARVTAGRRCPSGRGPEGAADVEGHFWWW
jgi:hypothetical protein